MKEENLEICIPKEFLIFKPPNKKKILADEMKKKTKENDINYKLIDCRN